VRRVATIGWVAVLVLGLASLSACAGSGSSGSKGSSRRGDYYGGSIHRNSFPETFGGGGPGRIGRPDRYRY